MMRAWGGLIAVFNWLSICLLDLFSHASQFVIAPVLAGVAASAALFGVTQLWMSGLAASLFILFISIVTGWFLYRRHKHAVEQLLYKQEQIKIKKTSFYTQIFPLWSKQIQTSRIIGDKAISELTVLFGEIVSRMGAMLKMSSNGVHAGNGKGLLGVIETSQSDFRSVFEELKTALETVNDSKEMILAEVTMHSANMREIAADAKQMSMQSKIIALNAEIEAARAGETGRAFAAVVAEMRDLASQSAVTSESMAKKVESIDLVMSKFYQDEKQMTEMEERHVSQAETLFGEVVKRFSAIAVDLEESIEMMEEKSREVKDDISSALMSLQFQDRLSQIMSHVADNIDALNELTRAGVNNLDADTWINEMKSEFSVDEEHGNVNGNNANSEKQSLLTFF